MTERNPVAADPMTAGATTPTPWARAHAILEAVPATYWLATVRPDGAPYVRPVLAVWVDGGLYFCAGEHTRKARNLVLDPRCVVTVEQEPLDLATAGPPPYDVYEAAPTAPFGFGIDETFGPTRWRFGEPTT